MKVLELNTGLFPDAGRVGQAVETLHETHEILRADVAGLAPEDKEGWAAVAREILSADLVVTL